MFNAPKYNNHFSENNKNLIRRDRRSVISNLSMRKTISILIYLISAIKNFFEALIPNCSFYI